jgi:hypothetical protein
MSHIAMIEHTSQSPLLIRFNSQISAKHRTLLGEIMPSTTIATTAAFWQANPLAELQVLAGCCPMRSIPGVDP